MTYDLNFKPLPSTEGDPAAHLRRRTPAVFRGLAADWPAVGSWTFPRIAALGPALPVRLVRGNRETTLTEFTRSDLGTYLRRLSEPPVADHEPLYLKEFDLLKAFPELRADLRELPFLPGGGVASRNAWIGPAGARTGLHQDLLDNCAVQITGTKRFLLARPGTVERAGALSAKYDAWARLSRVGIEELAAAGRAVADGALFVVDLEPGDVLYVPARWWHEVVNLSAGILLSGFYGSWPHVTRVWTQVQVREMLHRARLPSAEGCTCHPAR